MSKPKQSHTSRAWETGSGPGENDLYVCEEGGGDRIATIENGNMADRDLIAAAPDLLEACENALTVIQDLLSGYPERELHEHPAETIKRLALALSKAKGEGK